MSRQHMLNSRVLVAVCSALVGAAAAGSVVAYDGFSNGPLPDLNGSNGGVGWLGPWLDTGSALFTSVGGAGLTYPQLRSAAGAAITPVGGSFDAASYYRTFSTLPAQTDHVYFSFLLRPVTNHGTYGGISFGGYSLIGQPLTMNSWGMRLGRYIFADSGIPVVDNQTTLLVLKLQKTGASMVYSLYVNPNLNNGEPSLPSCQYTLGGAAFPSGLTLTNDGGFTSDELRIATTWAEAVPPPTTFCFSTTGPANAVECESGVASFTVAAVGSAGPFTYTWYKGAALVSDGPTGLGSVVSGATTGTLTIAGLTPADAGFYYALVTDPCGTVTSTPATLTVGPPCCPADFDRSGFVDFDDYNAFVLAFEAGDLSSDFDGSGFVDFDDFNAFVVAFEAGC